MGGIIRSLDGVAHAVGGVADHVHLLVGLRPVHRLSDVMRELKSESSGWVHRELGLPGFAWQEGYGAFSVGAPELGGARSYVLNQEAHHRKKSFQEEYVAMLKRGLVEYDDRYLW
jgi:putative transposase